MRAATYQAPGDPSVLYIAELPEPAPAADELLIRVEAISVEGGDLLARRSVARTGPSDILGYAAAGEVLQVGSAAAGFAVGQKVATFNFAGSYAEVRAVPAATSWIVPDGLDIKVAATIPCGPGTAALALQLGGLKPGETVLIQGAAGGVGIAAVQLAAKAGARVIGTGASPGTLEALRDYGLTDAIVVGDRSTSAQVRDLLGGDKVDLLIDNVGGAALADGLKVVTDGGRIALVGVFGGFNQALDAGHLLLHRLKVIGIFLGPIIGEPAIRSLIDHLLQEAANGALKTPIDAVFPLAEAAAAHRRAEERGRIGRVIITP